MTKYREAKREAWYALDCPPPNGLRSRIAVKLLQLAYVIAGTEVIA